MSYIVVTETGNRTVYCHMTEQEYNDRYGLPLSDWVLVAAVVCLAVVVISL